MDVLINSVNTAIKGEVHTLNLLEKSLFKGFDELGGDVVKYDQTADYYMGCKNQFITSVSGVMMLDKPAPWVFAGMSNDSCKDVYKEILRVIEDSKVELFAADNIRERVKSISDQLHGLSLSVENGCLIYRNQSTTGVNEGLSKYLPMFTDSEIGSFSEEDISEMRKARMYWREEFKLVNVSKLKRLGLMYIEMSGKDNRTTIADQFIRNKGGKPTTMSKFGSTPETRRIMMEVKSNFVADRKYWIRHSNTFSKSFNKEEPDEVVYSDLQKELIVKLTYSFKLGDKFNEYFDKL